MARVVYEAPVREIRGRLGQLIFQGYRGTFTARRFFPPTGAPTGRQTLFRSWFRFCSDGWERIQRDATTPYPWNITFGRGNLAPRIWWMQQQLATLDVTDPSSGDWQLTPPGLPNVGFLLTTPVPGTGNNVYNSDAAIVPSQAPPGRTGIKLLIMLTEVFSPPGAQQLALARDVPLIGTPVNVAIPIPNVGTWAYEVSMAWELNDNEGLTPEEAVVWGTPVKGTIVRTT